MVLLRRVEGKSMLPRIPAGKIVLAWKFLRPKVGDVVILRHKQREMIKRVSELRNGLVYVLGDNPGYSTDSRQFGWLPAAAILGVVRTGGRS